jgi:probable F420-dependent oxidoreductase
VKIGLMLPFGSPGSKPPGWAELRELAETAEASGLDSLWVADHFFAQTADGTTQGFHDGWTILSAVAAVTSRVELGPLVLCTGFRSPAVIANQAVTLDEVSGGRLVLGLGAGWHDPEYEAFGYPTDRKVSRFEEALEIVARLVRGERVTFDGRYHRVSDAVLAPPPERRTPVLVAAHGPRMLRLAARWADAWNTAWFESATDERLVERLRGLDDALAEQGRDPAEVDRTVGIIVRDDTDVEPLLSGLQQRRVAHVIAVVEPATRGGVESLASATRSFRGA